MHYALTVITEDGNYEAALAPFSENLKVKPYIDKTKQELIEETKNQHRFSIESNQTGYQKILETIYNFSDDDRLFKSIKKESISEGYTFDESDNRLTDYNPLSKWDWYTLGGRFADLLILTKEAYKERIKKHWINKCDKKTSEAKVKEIDFGAYKLSKSDEKRMRRFWEVHVEGKPLKVHEKRTKNFNDLYKKEYYLMQYQDVDNYILHYSTYNTPAMLYLGEWIEPSDDTNTKAIRDYQIKFAEILANLSPELIISVVDCHI